VTDTLVAEKVCTKCGEQKPTSAFSSDRRNRDGRQSACRLCHVTQTAAWRAAHRAEHAAYHAAYNAAHRAEHAAYQRARYATPEGSAYSAAWRLANAEHVAAHQAARRARFRAQTQAIKLAAGCLDCGYREDPTKLLFHHLNDDKAFGVSAAWSRSWAKVEAEIAKCVVVCTWCHNKRHAAERNEMKEVA